MTIPIALPCRCHPYGTPLPQHDSLFQIKRRWSKASHGVLKHSFRTVKDAWLQNAMGGDGIIKLLFKEFIKIL